MRTRSVTAREEGKDKEDEDPIKKKRRLKMQRYRNNVRNDPERIQKMREKDRERKRKKREEQRTKINKGDKKLENELKEKHRKYVAKYRAKKKKKKNTTEKNVKEVNEKKKKENAVLRTKIWRLRVKISDGKKAKSGTSNEKKLNQTSGEEETEIMQIGPASTERIEIII